MYSIVDSKQRHCLWNPVGQSHWSAVSHNIHYSMYLYTISDVPQASNGKPMVLYTSMHHNLHVTYTYGSQDSYIPGKLS